MIRWVLAGALMSVALAIAVTVAAVMLIFFVVIVFSALSGI